MFVLDTIRITESIQFFYVHVPGHRYRCRLDRVPLTVSIPKHFSAPGTLCAYIHLYHNGIRSSFNPMFLSFGYFIVFNKYVIGLFFGGGILIRDSNKKNIKKVVRVKPSFITGYMFFYSIVVLHSHHHHFTIA